MQSLRDSLSRLMRRHKVIPLVLFFLSMVFILGTVAMVQQQQQGLKSRAEEYKFGSEVCTGRYECNELNILTCGKSSTYCKRKFSLTWGTTIWKGKCVAKEEYKKGDAGVAYYDCSTITSTVGGDIPPPNPWAINCGGKGLACCSGNDKCPFTRPGAPLTCFYGECVLSSSLEQPPPPPGPEPADSGSSGGTGGAPVSVPRAPAGCVAPTPGIPKPTPSANYSLSAGEHMFRWGASTNAKTYAIRVEDYSDRKTIKETLVDTGYCDNTNKTPPLGKDHKGDECALVGNTLTYKYDFEKAGWAYRWWVHGINSCGIFSDAPNPNYVVRIACGNEGNTCCRPSQYACKPNLKCRSNDKCYSDQTCTIQTAKPSIEPDKYYATPPSGVSWPKVSNAADYRLVLYPSSLDYETQVKPLCGTSRGEDGIGAECRFVKQPTGTTASIRVNYAFGANKSYRWWVTSRNACGIAGGSTDHSTIRVGCGQVNQACCITNNVCGKGLKCTNNKCVAGPTPTGGAAQRGNVTLSLKLKFQGVVAKPKDADPIKVKVTIDNDDGAAKVQTGEFTPAGSGIWSGTVTFNNVLLGGGYKVFVKGPKHVQKKICDAVPDDQSAPGSYSCSDGKITLAAGENTLNFSNIYLLVGDLPGQDGVVTAYDTSYIRQNLGKTDESVVTIGDVNYDGIVDTQDLSLVIQSLSVKYDEE